jgi:hypothetical protein
MDQQQRQIQLDNQRRAEQQQRQAARLSQSQQQQRIREQQVQIQRYNDRLELQERLARQRAENLRLQNRLARYRYQQQYYEMLRQQQLQAAQWRSYNWYNDPYYYTAPSYRYFYSGRYYTTNTYGADLLRQAINYGYQQGFQAGLADREDRWGYDYRNSFAYEDANYGYYGYYVNQSEYNYYFREGFRRGYEDAYYGRNQYGYYSNGQAAILTTVLSAILNLVPLS